jgi:hydrogenase nickel incorporation protein HypA/HybF
MHEAMVAENVIESILDAVKGRNGKVIRVVISCGQTNAVNDDAMQFAFAAAAQDTICKGATLEIKHIPLRSLCRKCGLEFDLDFYNPHCPDCGESDFSIGRDSGLLLEEIEFEEDI